MRASWITVVAVCLCLSGSKATHCEDTAPEFQGYHATECEGFYPGHLQGIAVDGQGHIFWSFTTKLVSTDAEGQILKVIDVPSHHGDLTYVDGKLYVAVNLGDFNNPKGNADSWVYVYQAEDLSLLAKHEVQEVVYGAGGIAHNDGRFIVVGGLPEGTDENYVYEYDGDFNFQRRHVVPSGYTYLGIQSAEYADEHWWFGCYGKPQQLVIADEAFGVTGRYDFDCSYGIASITPGKFLVTTGPNVPGKGRTGAVQIAVPDESEGLKRLSSE